MPPLRYVSWSGPASSGPPPPAIPITVDQVGCYYFSAYNTAYGNTCEKSSLRRPSSRALSTADSSWFRPMGPSPGDSVLLFTYGAATGWEWSGPVSAAGQRFHLGHRAGRLLPHRDALSGLHLHQRTADRLNFSPHPSSRPFPRASSAVEWTVDAPASRLGPGSTNHVPALPLFGSGEIRTVTAAGTCYLYREQLRDRIGRARALLLWESPPTTVSAAFDTTAYLLCENEPLVLTAPDERGHLPIEIPGGTGQQLVAGQRGRLPSDSDRCVRMQRYYIGAGRCVPQP